MYIGCVLKHDLILKSIAFDMVIDTTCILIHFDR